jgi:tetratricopeptide (TPR) repeat protein
MDRALKNIPQPEFASFREEVGARFDFIRGRYNRAYDYWTQIGDTTYDGRYNTILAAYKSGHASEAIEMSERILPKLIGAQRLEILTIAANAAIADSNWIAARTFNLGIIRIAPGNSEAYLNLAAAHLHLGDKELARSSYAMAVSLKPSLRQQGFDAFQAAETAKISDSILTTTPLSLVDSLYNVAVEFQNNGDDSAAVVLYSRILVLDTAYAPALNNLGVLKAAEGELDTAVLLYKKACASNPLFVEAYANAAAVYLSVENYNDAQSIIEEGLKQVPADTLLIDFAKKVERAAGAKKRSGNSRK